MAHVWLSRDSEVHQRNQWIFTIFSLRTGREQHVPNSSDHSLYLIKLLYSGSPEGNCGGKLRRVCCTPTHAHTNTHTHTTRQDKTRQDKTRQDKTRQDKTRQDKTRQDKTRQDKTRQDKTRQDPTKREERREERRERHFQIHVQMHFFSMKTRHPRVRPHPDLP